ncbi:ABC transporter permease [Plastoroseomonas arctica]|uniref:ABC transporter permease n=1 Tax=Plastoroseomonas arctica TaxID=1509237 RepID=A0AAF1JU64_9PROT|nr:FtsX-like permease family protein [Plastoroseomonas arctica]MBR0653671.1 ABC transporter permease [Plastoroseomonas arctica]
MIRWLPFEGIAALRFMREGWIQTIFILVGVSLGVAVTVFETSILTGVQANFLKRVLTSQAHIVLLPPDEVARPLHDGPGIVEDATLQRPNQRLRSIDQWQTIRATVASTPGVRVVASVASGAAMAVRGDATASISIIGAEPEDYFRIVRVPDYIVAGTWRLTSDDILIGTDLATLLGVTVGDRLFVTGRSPTPRALTITAIFDLGSKGANLRTTFVAFRTGQSLLNLVGGVTSLEIAVADAFAAETIAQDLSARTGVRADSWIKTNAQFFTAVQAQNTSNIVISSAVALSVAFGVASVLVVSVVQRGREIGILRAMGARRGQVLLVFLLQGGVLGFLGAVLGSLIGAGLLLVWHDQVRQTDGTELFPYVLDPLLIGGTLAFASVVGLLAGMAPAMQAARLDPAVAIRG